LLAHLSRVWRAERKGPAGASPPGLHVLATAVFDWPDPSTDRAHRL